MKSHRKKFSLFEFIMTLPLSSRFSLYLNIYFTDVLGIDDASVSAVGGVLAAVMLASGLLLIPRLNRRIGSVRDICRYLGAGFLVMIPFQLMMVFAPRHNLLYVCAGMCRRRRQRRCSQIRGWRICERPHRSARGWKARLHSPHGTPFH